MAEQSKATAYDTRPYKSESKPRTTDIELLASAKGRRKLSLNPLRNLSQRISMARRRSR